MAKIGTAHIEVKPVLNEEALAAVVQQIEDAVARGVERGLNAANKEAQEPLVTWRNGERIVINRYSD